jgi:uncharacterized protein YdaU (DUF1376 family)
MNKSPAFQTYAADFYMDTAGWDPYAVGVYWRLLMYEWINDGLPTDPEQLARIGGAKPKIFNHFWDQFVSSKFSVNGNGKLINKRLENVRQNQLKYSESRRKNVSGRYKDKVTYVDTYKEHSPYIDPALQSSSSSSSSKDIKKKKNILSDDEFLKSLKEKFTWVDFEKEMIKIDAWLLANPSRQKTRRFIVKWISKVERPITTLIKPIPTKERPGIDPALDAQFKDAISKGWKV